MKISSWLIVIAIMAYLYYVILILYVGKKATFARFWLMLSVAASIGSGILYILMRKEVQIPFEYTYVIGGGMSIIIMLFLVIEYQIIYYAHKKPMQQADYIIILGAKVNGIIPSRALRGRIHKGVEYLKNNPETKVIASGGKGDGEYISEAEAMKRVLQDEGISTERIIVEDESTNTVQNISYSKRLIKDHRSKVVIITSDFHMWRSYLIAKKQGLECVSGAASKSAPIMRLNYYTREFFALIKEKIKGHI